MNEGEHTRRARFALRCAARFGDEEVRAYAREALAADWLDPLVERAWAKTFKSWVGEAQHADPDAFAQLARDHFGGTDADPRLGF